MQAAIRDIKPVPGLCSVCKNVQGCVKRQRDGLIIWYCEECGGLVDSEIAPHLPPPVASADEFETPDRLMGLCVNCERRDYCAHAKRAGGVWHCEEYL